MSDLPKWALDKALWFSDRHYGMSRASQRELAALLVEVREKARVELLAQLEALR